LGFAGDYEPIFSYSSWVDFYLVSYSLSSQLYLNYKTKTYVFFFLGLNLGLNLFCAVERQIAAIRAMRDVGIEHLLTELRLLRSYFTKEQLKTPVLQFFKENLPNLSIERNEENGEFLVKFNDNVDGFSDGGNINASLLRRLSMAYPSCSANLSVGHFGLSSDAGKTKKLRMEMGICFYRS
jgi:hypothetical protein